MEIKVKKLSDKAILPTRNTDGEAGYDLYATEDYVLKPLERKLFKTNLAIAIPKGYYGRIAPRSGLAFKNGIDVMAGVIDSTYRHDVGVVLINLNHDPILPLATADMFAALRAERKPDGTNNWNVKAGERIAQIIIEKCHDAEWEETEELDETERKGGFGSSGK